jgi:DNA polymerase III sliding clamp (beta) subunit (PCNA family)
MNIKFKIGKFLEALDIVSMTIDKRGNLETKDVLFSAVKTESEEVLFFYGTDFVNQSAIKLSVNVIDTGTWSINPAQLYTALSKRDPELEANLILDEKQAIIKVGRGKFKLDVTNKIGLLSRLKLMPFNETPLFTIAPTDLVDVFKRSKTCVSTDVNNTNRYIMRGIHIKSSDKSYIIESTDGFVASSIELKQNKEVPNLDIIVPGEFTPILLNIAGRALKQKLPLQLIKNEYLYFKFGDVIVGTTIMIGKFPTIETIINSSLPEFTLDFDHTTIKSAVERVLGFESFSLKNLGKIGIQLKEESLFITAISVPDCEEIIDFVPPEDIEIPKHKLNIGGQKMLEIINSSSLSNIKIGISKRIGSPLYLEETIPDRLTARYVIMPSRT